MRALGYAGGQVCTVERREPCQAGNRAALSGVLFAMQVACPPVYSRVRVGLAFLSGGGVSVSGPLQKMETDRI